MKKLIKLIMGSIILFVTLSIVGVGIAVWWASQEYVRPTERKSALEVTINKGDNIAEVLLYAGALETVQSQWVFNIAGKITGQDKKLKAGEYEIPPQASIRDLLNLLEEGKTILRQVTIPEGLTNWEIKQILLSTPNLEKGEEFLMLPEGSYLPQTYSYQKGEKPLDILTRMNQDLNKAIDQLWMQRDNDLPFKTKQEALILASIVEKETGVPEERKRVAGVFINRLRQGMPLQTDPTVIYAMNLGRHENDGQGPIGRKLLKKDLEIDSPYNTYLHAGLPPSPIANAGKEAIEAVLKPEKHEFIYFVADGSGGHVFAKTLEEHNRNVSNWRKINKN